MGKPDRTIEDGGQRTSIRIGDARKQLEQVCYYLLLFLV